MNDYYESIVCPTCGHEFINDNFDEDSLTLEEMDEYFDGEDYKCPICEKTFSIERFYCITPKNERRQHG